MDTALTSESSSLPSTTSTENMDVDVDVDAETALGTSENQGVNEAEKNLPSSEHSSKRFLPIYRQSKDDPTRYDVEYVELKDNPNPSQKAFPNPTVPSHWPDVFRENELVQQKYEIVHYAYRAWRRSCFRGDDDTIVIAIEERMIKATDDLFLYMQAAVDPRVARLIEESGGLESS